MSGTQIKAIIGIIILGVFGAFGLCNLFTVESTERVVISRLGEVKEVLGPGLHTKVPFMESRHTYSLIPKQIELEISLGDNSAVSQDLQQIGLNASVNYKYNEESLLEIAKTYNESKIEQLIKNAFISSIKVTIGKYTIYDIVKSTDSIRNEVLANTINELNNTNVPVEIKQMVINNWDWPQAFDNQIETTMRKKQEVEQAKQDLAKEEQNALKVVKAAEAQKKAAEVNADAAIIQAQAKAKSDTIEANAIAYKNSQIAKNLQIEIKMKELEIAKIRAEKWDGTEVPQNMWSNPLDMNARK